MLWFYIFYETLEKTCISFLFSLKIKKRGWKISKLISLFSLQPSFKNSFTNGKGFFLYILPIFCFYLRPLVGLMLLIRKNHCLYFWIKNCVSFNYTEDSGVKFCWYKFCSYFMEVWGLVEIDCINQPVSFCNFSVAQTNFCNAL